MPDPVLADLVEPEPDASEPDVPELPELVAPELVVLEPAESRKLIVGGSTSEADPFPDVEPLPVWPPTEGATSAAGDGLTLLVGVPVGSALGSALGLVSVPVLGSELELELWVGVEVVTAGPAVGRSGFDGAGAVAEEPWGLGCCDRSRTTMRPMGRPELISAASCSGAGADPEEPGIA